MAVPTVEGPVTDGRHGWPFAATLVDIGAQGYVEEEYFFGGTAVTYQPAGPLELDGRWKVEEGGHVRYRTRMLVRRPKESSRFSGTVLVAWINVSSGYDIVQLDSAEILEGGHAVVAVSAQSVGIHGYDAPDPLGLTVWDPERYGNLSIPTDDASYDVFTQAAQLVGPRRSTASIDPLAGLEVTRLIAIGGSQSAARLHTYFNAIAPLSRVFDGFLLELHFGSGAPLFTGGEGRPSGLSPTRIMNLPGRLRTDLGVPVMVVNTESEALSYFPVRQPDTDQFRLWESAGTCHAANSRAQLQTKERHEWGRVVHPPADLGGVAPNTLDITPIRDAAIHHIHRWLAGGIAPPAQPRLHVRGAPPTIERDEHGIAKGGIRLPDVEVPVAILRGAAEDGDLLAAMLGSCVPFDDAKLRTLYPTHDAYPRRYQQAAQRGLQAGFLLPRDAARMVAETVQSRPLLAQ